MTIWRNLLSMICNLMRRKDTVNSCYRAWLSYDLRSDRFEWGEGWPPDRGFVK